MTKHFELRRVRYMPSHLDQGILYVSQKFGAAAHLCACGCGTIVRTPLDRWSLTETRTGPSLVPSIGNWQEPCQSHYFITHGEVRWADRWTPEQVLVGQHHEQKRILAHYAAREQRRVGAIRRFLQWLKNIF